MRVRFSLTAPKEGCFLIKKKGAFCCQLP